MSSPVSPLFRVPRAAESNIGQPVLGRTLVGLAGALNHLNGIQARGFVPVAVYQQAALASGNAGDVGFFVDEPPHYETICAPFYVPVGVDLIHLALVCLARATGGTAHPTVTATIEDDAAGVVDEGCVWTRETGTLPGLEHAGATGYYLRPFVVESSPRFASTDPTSGPTDPRRLSVGAKQGGVAILKIASTYARVVAAWAMPVPAELLA